MEFSRLVFWFLTTSTLLIGVFISGLYSGVRRSVAYEFVDDARQSIIDAFSTLSEELPNLTGEEPVWYLQPARFPGDGVTVDRTNDDGRILLSGFIGEGNEIRLIRRDGTVLARWPVSFSQLFPDTSHLPYTPATDWNIDLHGALILPDGSVVFNFEYSGLVRLDRCGTVLWTLAARTHHSVEIAETGGFWVPSRRRVLEDTNSPHRPFAAPYEEDTILRVSDDGAVLTEKSVVTLFYDNGLEPLLTATGASFYADSDWDQEIVHLNKIGELPRALAGDFPEFEAGDLVLSIRELNMVLVVDSDVETIKWWRIGPWVRQHDPEFSPGGTISVFNNNTYREALGPDNPFDTSFLSIPRVSNIVAVDPATGEYRRVYGGREGQEMLSVIRGKQDPTPEGGFFVTEFEAGRVFETDRDGNIVWEYINRYDEHRVTELTEARLYPPDYFDVGDWACASGESQ